MNRKKEALKPEVQDGRMPEVMMAIMPDYPKWNRLFFQLDCVFVIINFLLACVFILIFLQEGQLEFPISIYTAGYALMPSILNVIILLAAAMLRKRLPQKDMRQNAIPVFVMLLLNIVVSMTSGFYLITLAIFCIPICMTTVYSNKKMCRIVTYISLGDVLITLAGKLMESSAAEEAMSVVPQGFIAVCTLATMGMVAQTAIKMTDGQKNKLIHYAISIKEEQQRAEAASNAKSAFLANMSHEIRTPINAILGMNEMILRENRNEQIEDYAKSIYSAGNALLYLVNDVLDISKIESGRLEITEDIYELSSFIFDCYNMVAEKAGEKGLELKVMCNPALPSRMKGDASRMRQVVTNLLSNAVKYTQEGCITLSFDGRESGGQMMLAISVKDTGIGISEEDQENLFTRFTRFDIEKNRNIEGTGLGLALAKSLTDLMNGTIDVQSIYGVGSSFTVTIPQQVIDPEPVGDFQQKYWAGPGKDGQYEQSFEAPEARILVVDDVEINLKVMRNLLKSTKMKVDTALSGRQCLEMVTQTKYDIIFMDHMMPGMNGVDTYAEMKKLTDSLNMDTPVIMLTANAVTGVREQFLQSGFADYLSKPVSGDKLEKMIMKYLPDKKDHTETAAQKPDGETDDSGALNDLAMLYPQVDISEGLSICGNSSEAYIDILQTYANNKAADELNMYFVQKNASDYQITIHGIKGASLNSGFPNLAEQALALENAAREADWEFISTNHPLFIDEYGKAVSAIKKALNVI